MVGEGWVGYLCGMGGSFFQDVFYFLHSAEDKQKSPPIHCVVVFLADKGGGGLRTHYG
jgi:hypothetical protein